MSRGGVISLKFSLAKAAAATPPRFAKDSGLQPGRFTRFAFPHRFMVSFSPVKADEQSANTIVIWLCRSISNPCSPPAAPRQPAPNRG